MQVSAGFLWLSDIHCETSTRRDLLKPPQSFIDFNTPNRESNIQGICDENDAVLGRGAYGVVFRASYKKRNVAVKVLEKSNGVKYESIKREANILNLVHPNIVRILKIVDCKNYGAIIMERFEGKSLQQVIDQEKIDLLHRLYILSDIAKALIFCHENGIVHSDLKPQNVLVALNSNNLADRPYSCKILDFGCSSKVDEMFLDSNIGVSLSSDHSLSSLWVCLHSRVQFDIAPQKSCKINYQTAPLIFSPWQSSCGSWRNAKFLMLQSARMRRSFGMSWRKTWGRTRVKSDWWTKSR